LITAKVVYINLSGLIKIILLLRGVLRITRSLVKTGVDKVNSFKPNNINPSILNVSVQLLLFNLFLLVDKLFEIQLKKIGILQTFGNAGLLKTS